MNGKAANKTLLSEALDQKQYQELNHEIILTNDTSGVSFFEHQLIEINELRDDSICITLPKNICQKGHNLTLVLFESIPIKKVVKLPSPEAKGSISIIGKVIDLSENGKNKVLIEIKFTQYKLNEWQRIIETYLKQQDSISSLIDEVKK